METQKPYLSQYCELKQELQKQNISIDSASKEQLKQIQHLKEKALEQSGLKQNELHLIYTCRQLNLYKQISAFMFSLSTQFDEI